MSNTIKSIFKGFLFLSLLGIFLPGNLKAQTPFKGLVLDLNSDEKLFGVQVINLNNGQKVFTSQTGEFSIDSKLNDLLEFRQFGYKTDTLVITEFEYKRLYMSTSADVIRLDEVAIRGLSNQQLEEEIAKAESEGEFMETSQNRGGVRISLSRALGDKGRQARFRADQLKEEKTRRLIERRFSTAAIQALTPLDGEELEMFKAGFTPDSKFTLSATDEDFKLYIIDNYSKFKKLSTEEKKKLLLKSQNIK